LPFCHRTAKATKPKSSKYPQELRTLGDHIRGRRLQLECLQKEVALQIGVDEDTIYRWECNETSPSVRHVPNIIRFLGYNPLPAPSSAREKLLMARRRLGLSQKAMARRLGIDPTTLRHWELEKRRPSTRLSRITDGLLLASGRANRD
jgi:DNA-binding XRE family transcriptional regulator